MVLRKLGVVTHEGDKRNRQGDTGRATVKVLAARTHKGASMVAAQSADASNDSMHSTATQGSHLSLQHLRPRANSNTFQCPHLNTALLLPCGIHPMDQWDSSCCWCRGVVPMGRSHAAWPATAAGSRQLSRSCPRSPLKLSHPALHVSANCRIQYGTAATQKESATCFPTSYTWAHNPWAQLWRKRNSGTCRAGTG